MKTSLQSEANDSNLQFSRNELAMINQALDDLMKEVSDNHLPFLGTEGQRQGFAHTTFHDLFKKMQYSRVCCYPGCKDKSIARSHSLQKAGPLAFIAEDSHVVTPSFATDATGYTPFRVGVNEASTFPGFCPKHEAIFDFERTRDLKEDRDIELQVFRTICREATVKKIHVTHLQKIRKRHDALVAEHGMEFLRQRLGAAFVMRHGGLKKLTMKNVSKAQIVMKQCEEEVADVLRKLEDEFLPAAVEAIEGKGDRLYHFSVIVNQPLPICLAGCANFWVDDHGKQESVSTILNVIPSRHKTVIVATCLARNRDYLNVYIQDMLSRMNGMLTMVETWMVRGTDHWFMTPSEWENIPEVRRLAILNDMLDESKSLYDLYPNSILDSVRLQTLRLPEAKAEPREVYESEASKLADRDLV